MMTNIEKQDLFVVSKHGKNYSKKIKYHKEVDKNQKQSNEKYIKIINFAIENNLEIQVEYFGANIYELIEKYNLGND